MEGEVTIRDVMSREYVGVSESDTVLGAVKLMCDEEVGSVVVLRGSEPVGIMTESDVLALVAEDGTPAEATVGEIMSQPVISMPADRGLGDAAGTMSREDIRRIVVTENGSLVGVLTERDVISASASLSSLARIQESPPTAEREVREELSAEASMNTDDGAEYSSQSICEVCGTLTRDLANVNGQLICANCREV